MRIGDLTKMKEAVNSLFGLYRGLEPSCLVVLELLGALGMFEMD